jgi:hypothetical protein
VVFVLVLLDSKIAVKSSLTSINPKHAFLLLLLLLLLRLIQLLHRIFRFWLQTLPHMVSSTIRINRFQKMSENMRGLFASMGSDLWSIG